MKGSLTMILSKEATDLQTMLEEYLPAVNGAPYDIMARLLEQVWDEGVNWGREQYSEVPGPMPDYPEDPTSWDRET